MFAPAGVVAWVSEVLAIWLPSLYSSNMDTYRPWEPSRTML